MHHDDTIATQVGNPSVFGHGMLIDGPRGAGREGLVRPRGDPPVPGALREAGVAGRRAHVHRGRHRQARGGRRARSSTSTSPSSNQNGDKAITGAATAAVALTRWGCSTGGSRSSPDRGAASAASSRCASRARARKVVVNDVGVSLDGRGTEDDPAAQVCKEIEALGGAGGAELRLGQRLRRRRAASCRPRSTRSARSTSSSTTPASCATARC